MMSRTPSWPLILLLLCAPFALAEEETDPIRSFESRLIQTTKKVSPAVVSLMVVRRGRSGPDGAPERVESGGSGVIISEDGYVLTCEHVVGHAEEIHVGLPDGRRLRARLLGYDEAGDIALIKLPGKGYSTLPLGDSDTLEVGAWVLALGHPFGLNRDHVPSVSLGIVSGLNRYQGGGKIYGAAIQTDAAINPGNSGGPLVDLKGRLVGINGRISTRDRKGLNVGIGFAIPINQIRLILDDLKEGKIVERAFLGVLFDPDYPGRGCLVKEVLGDTAAAEVGLRNGDVIVSVDGEPILHSVRLQNKISFLPAGSEIEITVRREGELKTFELTLGARPKEFR